MAVCRVELIADGDLAAYDSAKEEAIARVFAINTHRVQSWVQVSVVPASVRIRIDITAPSISTAEIYQEVLSNKLATAEAATSFLSAVGIVVVTAPRVYSQIVPRPTPPPPPPPPQPLPPPPPQESADEFPIGAVVGGVIVTIVVAAAGCGFYALKKRRGSRKRAFKVDQMTASGQYKEELGVGVLEPPSSVELADMRPAPLPSAIAPAPAVSPQACEPQLAVTQASSNQPSVTNSAPASPHEMRGRSNAPPHVTTANHPAPVPVPAVAPPSEEPTATWRMFSHRILGGMMEPFADSKETVPQPEVWETEGEPSSFLPLVRPGNSGTDLEVQHSNLEIQHSKLNA